MVRAKCVRNAVKGSEVLSVVTNQTMQVFTGHKKDTGRDNFSNNFTVGK
jgi:hypothetical protein